MEKEMEKIDEMFEWTDFGGEFGGNILWLKLENDETQENARDKIKHAISTLLKQKDERISELEEIVKNSIELRSIIGDSYEKEIESLKQQLKEKDARIEFLTHRDKGA